MQAMTLKSTTDDVETETVILKGGLSVSLDALRLGWRLEERGVTLRPDGDGLAVGPRGLLSDEDRGQIRTHRDELLALVRYVEYVEVM
jgi:TubC N-terminal docking domain